LRPSTAWRGGSRSRSTRSGNFRKPTSSARNVRTADHCHKGGAALEVALFYAKGTQDQYREKAILNSLRTCEPHVGQDRGRAAGLLSRKGGGVRVRGVRSKQGGDVDSIVRPLCRGDHRFQFPGFRPEEGANPPHGRFCSREWPGERKSRFFFPRPGVEPYDLTNLIRKRRKRFTPHRWGRCGFLRRDLDGVELGNIVEEQRLGIFFSFSPGALCRMSFGPVLF